MAIPPLLASPAILPPFTGSDPTAPAARSPYQSDLIEVIQRFTTSAKRQQILRGLIAYRRDFRRLGFDGVFQWLGGSFVENRGTDPNDIDIVTVYSVTAPVVAAIRADATKLTDATALFDPVQSKAKFFCDAYTMNLGTPPEGLIAESHYWYGLFSHQRVSQAWKGMVRIEIPSLDDDSAAETILNSITVP